MDSQLSFLYKQIKEKKITREDALKQIKEYKTNSSAISATENYTEMIGIGEEVMQDKAIRYFKKLLSSVIKLPINRIEENAPMEKYGIDSIMVMQLTNELERIFGSLPKTLFFEYENIQQITDYFLTSYRNQMIELLNIEDAVVANSSNSIATENVRLASRSPRRLRSPDSSVGIEKKEAVGLDVAIIGVSGRYPRARSIREFWENLRDGRDCITEVPKDRWNHSEYFDEDKELFGKTYSKWGGFLEGVDQFDPLFFNISPRDAQFMDPQERIFLECVFETLEDAGYTRQALSLNQESNLERNIGVYVGVMYEEYQLYGAQEQTQGRPIALSGNPASVANRVSYFYNFHGPSIAIDTMCSSSLTAIHLACQSLQQGECKLAIAGGVNISIHVNKYLMLAQGKMLSSKGRCQSFGQGGDGYVPGEGVGAVLLKPLSKAIADNDQIYGIIKGTAINHGGKTNGYTVPNINAQAEVIRQAFAETGINPRMISYIEAHGTGTSLGDPIEIAGLNKVFQEYTKDKQFCTIGSAKSNIGHCESAAGIAGVTKVLLQLKYRQLAPSLHSKTLNPNIDFNNTPFVVQQELTEWKRPVIDIKGKKVEYPRIAGISSFGAGGSNAHVVIEEYIPEDQERVPIKITSQHPAIIVLSAKNEERLHEKVKQLLRAIKELELSDANLADVAYTLQIGREAMEERIAIVVASIEEMEEKLTQFLERQEDIEELYQGKIKSNKENLAVLGSDEDMAIMVDSWISKRKYTKLLEFWVKGLTIDWNKMYKIAKPQKISLPTYPFARESYWVPEFETNVASKIVNIVGSSSILHPLLHQNTSDLTEQRFSSIFSGKEFFFVDPVKGQRALPELVYLEMVREAVERAVGTLQEGQEILLNNIIWIHPIVANEESVQVHIELIPEDKGQISFEIYSQIEGGNGEVVVYSRGTAVIMKVPEETAILDLSEIQRECSLKRFNSSQCYDTLRGAGFDYGPGYQGIETVYVGSGQVLAKIVIPSFLSDTQKQFVLHPSLLNAAFQASIGFMINLGDCKQVLPAALQEFEIIDSSSSILWAWIRYNGDSSAGSILQKLDIDLCDSQGKVCVRMKALEMQENIENGFTPNLQALIVPKKQEAFEIMTFEEIWQDRDLSNSEPIKIKTLVCFLSELENQQSVLEVIHTFNSQTKVIFISQSSAQHEHSQDVYYISRKDRQTYEQALESIREDYGDVDGVLYLWSIEDPVCIEDYSVIVYILQSIAAVKLKARKVLLGAQFQNGLERCYLDSWIGFERSLGLVLPNTQVAVMYQENDEQNKENFIKDWMKKLWGELQTKKVQSVLYQKGKRHVYQIKEMNLQAGSSLLQEGCTYLITGGCGGLGYLFAKHFARNHSVNLLLTGRSALDEKKRKKIEELEELGSRVLYIPADVCDVSSMKAALSQAKEEFGEIHGVIHAAGLAGTQSIFEKDLASFSKTLEPKIKGSLVLDEVLQEEALHFICYFSSSAAILGDFGSCDYAIGNRFQMAYAQYRQEEQRQGKTIVINWPLWKEGGMGIGEEENSELYLKSSGQRFLEAEEGTTMFDRILSQNNTQQLVLVGQPSRVKRFLGLSQEETAVSRLNLNSSSKGRRPQMKGLSLEQCVQWDLKEYIGQLLKILPNKLEEEENLADFGFDSISLVQFANLLSNHYGIELTATLFFGYSTIKKLTQYFLTEHRETIHEFYKKEIAEQPVLQKISVRKTINHKPQKDRFEKIREKGTQDLKQLDSIAIVGISGKFPMAEDVHELWDNLVEGKNCITEIPKERWDWQECYGDSKEVNKASVKWGGFINGIDEFDSLFFKISPKEAGLMDPKQRLLLTYVRHAIEDAGITPKELSKRPTGVFVAACPSEYTDILSTENNNLALTAVATTVLPTRISYAFDLQGPSEYCDTACSSTLVALHRAVQAIRNGECEQAIVGAINLLISPMGFIGLNSMGYLSPDGKAKSFQADANGFVRSEGVGVIIIKSLEKAIKDQDQIYAIVKGTGVSHGGKGMSLTAPSENGMKAAMIQAYQAARIDPRTVSYIETHGIASPLGDGIEINALKAGYQELVRLQPQHIQVTPCYISSLKPSIGHTEVASGMAALIKVILAMRHRMIPAIMGFTNLSEHISLEKTPFHITEENCDWEVLKDNYGNRLPRRASINGYGFSGVNAHVVLEEYIPVNEQSISTRVTSSSSQVIVLSAKNNERLKDYAQNLLMFLKKHQGSNENKNNETKILISRVKEEIIDYFSMLIHINKEEIDPTQSYADQNIDYVHCINIHQYLQDKWKIDIDFKVMVESQSINELTVSLVKKYEKDIKKYSSIIKKTNVESDPSFNINLADLAYTLQVGRETMESRVSFIAKDINELAQKLEEFIDEKENAEGYFMGEVNKEREAFQFFGKDDDFKELVQKWMAKEKIEKLAELWSKGLDVEWNLLYLHDIKPQRVSLPTYPFAKERYSIFSQQERKFSLPKKEFKNKEYQQNAFNDTLGYITKSIQDILGLPSDFTINPKTQLAEYGMDSISGIQLLEELGRVGIQLDGRRFFSEFSLQEIINQLQLMPSQDKVPLLPWEKDKKLPESLIVNSQIIPFKHSNSWEKVFLTGATGLLGAFLCNEILNQTSAIVYCLVRAETESLGLKRIQDNFVKYELWLSSYQSRIIPVLGDITKPQLGIEKGYYDELSQSIDIIYHCAAIPNHILNYYSLKNPNVNGTLSIIEFAGSGKVKPINFTSTISVCYQVNGDEVLPAHQYETLLDHGRNLSSGYAQSKWVSEHHLLQAQKKGIPVAIFRCGEITGSSQNGYGIAEDMFHNFLKVFSGVDVIPQWENSVMDIVPIDYVTQAILAISQQKSSYGEIYNLNHPNPIPVEEFFKFLQKKKPTLSKVSFEEWADCCLLYIDKLPESTMKTILRSFFIKLDSGHRIFEYYFNKLNISNDNIQNALQNTKVQFPQMDEKWWEKCTNQISLFGRK